MSNNHHHQQNNHQWHGGGDGGAGGGCGGGGSNNNNNSGVGPCGACKYLRRKCVKGCVFAPYFDSEQGTAHFAAVHKVFGASNASKLLLRIPAHRRLDAVVTLCYEALSRIRDPVYGCVSHIFALLQQVINMQAELARLSTLQPLPAAFPAVDQTPPSHYCYLDQISAPTTAVANTTTTSTSTAITITSMPSFENFALNPQPSLSSLSALEPVTAADLANFCNLTDHYNQHDDPIFEDGDLQTLTREFVSKYLPGVKFKSEPH